MGVAEASTAIHTRLIGEPPEGAGRTRLVRRPNYDGSMTKPGGEGGVAPVTPDPGTVAATLHSPTGHVGSTVVAFTPWTCAGPSSTSA